jgi:hypothetical protein
MIALIFIVEYSSAQIIMWTFPLSTFNLRAVQVT